MRDKHIKTWLFVFVGTLAVASGAASFFAQQKTLYKGLEPLGKNFAQASVLTEETPFISQVEAAADFPSLVQIPQEEILPPPETTPIALQPVSSPCGSDEKPIIKNSQIVGCAKTSEQTHYKLQTINSNSPPLKIKILENVSLRGNPPAADTCESQGRFTYTGEDRPGLLYGMCIDCLTTQFAANDGACKK